MQIKASNLNLALGFEQLVLLLDNCFWSASSIRSSSRLFAFELLVESELN